MPTKRRARTVRRPPPYARREWTEHAAELAEALVGCDEELLLEAADVLEALAVAVQAKDRSWLSAQAMAASKYVHGRIAQELATVAAGRNGPKMTSSEFRPREPLTSKPILTQADEARYLVGLARTALSRPLSEESARMRDATPERMAAEFTAGLLSVGLVRCSNLWKLATMGEDSKRRRTLPPETCEDARARIVKALRGPADWHDEVVAERVVRAFLRALGVKDVDNVVRRR